MNIKPDQKLIFDIQKVEHTPEVLDLSNLFESSVPKWERKILAVKDREEYLKICSDDSVHPVVKQAKKSWHFFKWFVKLLTPDFLIGHPNFIDNLKTLRKNPQFKPFRMAIVAWMIFVFVIGSIGIYSLINASRTFATFATITDDSKSLFDAGTYSDTQWNGTNNWIDLNDTGKTNLTGTYISGVKDATSNTTWRTLAWTTSRPYYKELPNNAVTETGYLTGNADMTGNVLLMHLNETGANAKDGGVITDFSGQGNNGILKTNYDGLNKSTNDSIFNTAFSFDGNNDYIDCVNSTSLNITSAITLETWINLDELNANYKLAVSKWYDGSEMAYEIGIDTANNPFMVIKTTGSAYVTVASPSSVTAGSWYHIVGTYIDGTENLYVNGILVNSANPTGNLYTNNANLHIGSEVGAADSASNYFPGKIDEVAIYNRVLSSTEILDHYKRGSEKLKFQVRSCAVSDCSDGTWVGPDASASSYYSELNNLSNASAPSIPLSGLATNRYFQYKSFFNTDLNTTSPDFNNVTTAYENLPPNTPSNLSPINSSVEVSLSPTLASSVYSDPANNIQTGTKWELDNNFDFSSPEWTRTAGVAENSIAVNSPNGTFANSLLGKTKLDPNTTYYWRVSYQNSIGLWSSFSTQTSFATIDLGLYTSNVIPTMTSNTSPSGVASADSALDAPFDAWYAFNHVLIAQNGWHSSPGFPHWLQYQFASPKAIAKYTITSRNEPGNLNSPNTWKFQGSNNGSTYTDLDSQSGIVFGLTETKSFTFVNTTPYLYYRLYITSANGQNYAYVAIAEMEMMELSSPSSSFIDNSEDLFNVGTFLDTQWNGTNNWVDLNDTGKTNLTGTYISGVKDATSNTTWRTLSWITSRPYYKELPNNAVTETGYSTGNADMSGNVLLMHMNETGANAEEGGTIIDTSGQGNNGALLTGGDGHNKSTPNSRVNSALNFDGLNDYIETSLTPILTDGTIEAWIYPTSFNNYKAIVTKRWNVSGGWVFALYPGTGQLGFYSNNSAAWRVSSEAVPLNMWSHVSMKIESGVLKFYINGADAGGMTNESFTNDDNVVRIGAWDSAAAFPFSGVMDEVAIYSRALSSTEIWNHYKRGAEKLKFQVRSCAVSDCSDGTWVGPDNSSASYFSELNSTSTNSTAELSLSGLNNSRYIQYKAYFNTLTNTLSPDFNNVTIGLGNSEASSGPCSIAIDDANYIVCKYTSDGNFTPPVGVSSVTYLVVGGGGGGSSGGGGAGGYLTGTLNVSAQVYPVTVGNGGAGKAVVPAGNAINGGDSIFSTITAKGGGGGAPIGDVGPLTAADGGSGGGGGSYSQVTTYGGAASPTGQGNAGGGNGGRVASPYPSGGGGGAGAVGQDGSAATVSGNGGAGLSNSISGYAVTYAGGGGGGLYLSGTAGRGGVGGGGDGGMLNESGKEGNVNSGGGGGGAGGSGIGGFGGSGIVIIRYLANHMPDTPSNSSPANLAMRLQLSPTLISSAFSDPDIGDTQTAAEWQITTASGNYSSPIYDSGIDISNLTSNVIPNNILSHGVTYYWHVRHEDNRSGWSSYSNETSFTTVNLPAAPTNITPVSGAINQEPNLSLSSSAFSDSDVGASQSAAEWQVRSSTDAVYTSPLYDSGTSTSHLTSISVPSGNLSKNKTYYWHVRYKDDLGNWSAYSAETVFTTGITPISTVSIGATEYQSGEIAKLTVQIENAAGEPIDAATVNITIYNPSNSAVVSSESMSHLSGSNGLYYYNYTIPATEGVYTYQVSASYNDNTSYSSHAFHVSPALNTIAALNTNLNTVSSNVSALNTNLTNASTSLSSQIQSNAAKLDLIKSNSDIIIGALIVTQSTVNDAAASATSFVTALTKSTNDFYKNAVLTFTSGELNGQVRRISAYYGTTKKITLDPALTSAPENGDAFTITKQNVRVEEQAAGIAITVNDTNAKVTDVQSKVTDIQTKTNSIYSLLQTVDTNLSATQAKVNDLRVSQQKKYTLKLSDVGTVQASSTYRATLTVNDFESNPADALTIPTVIIYSPTRELVLATTTMNKISTGVYSLDYVLPLGAATGLWETIVKANTGGSEDNTLVDYWQVNGSPAQVIINSMSDITVPNITANIGIQNEGGLPYEYKYEYCVVSSQENPCGGSDDEAYGSGAKLIAAGDTFIKDLTLTVPKAGTYWFKILVYYGTEVSGASRQFTSLASGATPAAIASASQTTGTFQILTVDTIANELASLRQEIQNQSAQLAKTLAIMGDVDPQSSGFKSLLTVSLENTGNLKDIQNKINDLKAASAAAQQGTGSSAPVVQTYMKFNSVEIDFLVTNPLKKTQTIQFKAFLPEEARPENVLDSSGLKVEYDPNAKTYFVSGDISLGPKQSITKKVEMKDIWIFDESELNLMKQQASDLFKTLTGTQFESQGVILKGDIETTVNMVISKQAASYSSPQDHIVAYRENKDRVAKIQSELDQLKSLISQLNSSKSIVGSIGGIQTFSTWGIILAIILGFGLLAAIIFAMWRSQMMFMTAVMGARRRPLLLADNKKKIISVKHHIINKND